MRIYQNLGAGDETKLRPGTVGLPFRIEAATVVPNAYADKNALSLSLKESARDGYVCNYGIIGDELQTDFMAHMGVSKVEELVGKEVFGFIHKGEPVLQGLSPRN